MHKGKVVRSQLMEFLPWRRFDTCVRRYRGDWKIKSLSCAEQFRVMALAQLTYRHSLREIETCSRAMGAKLYYMGIRSSVSRNNLSHADAKREYAYDRKSHVGTLDKVLDMVDVNGWIIVNMKNDWKKIFPAE